VAGGGVFPPFVAAEALVSPLVAEVGLLLLPAGCWEPLPPFAPLELAFALPLASAADEEAEDGAEGPLGAAEACGGVGGGDCAPESGAAVLASRISANDCVSVPCTIADAWDRWEAWDARVALTSDAILDTAESL
jgi:hypothetical protein